MIDKKQFISEEVEKEEWLRTKCDKYDYMIAAFCGVAAGLIDVFFVGDPLTSVLGKSVDNVADGFVKKAAQFFWKNDKRTTGKSKKMPESLEQCISYLEQAFPVNYDARYAKDLVVEDNVLSSMRPINHHLLSLAHSPDPIGLIFSIINQFMGYSTFIDKGKLIHCVPLKTSGAIPYMQGSDLVSMLFCGFVNWIGHIISDLVGSSSTRKPGKTGRGAGIPIPFYELFLFCDFGNIDGKTLSETMINVFEKGYDFRFGVTMSIPVLMEELMIKVVWMIRQRFFEKKDWKECIPTKEHTDLRIMHIVGNGALCMVDGIDAAVHGITEGNIVSFICHLNFVGWVRFIMLIFRELKIRYGSIICEIIEKFVNSIMYDVKTPAEQKKIQELYSQFTEYDKYLAELFREFVITVEKEYQSLYTEINASFNEQIGSSKQAEHSVVLARNAGVDKAKIIENHKQLDDLFG